MVTYIPTEYLGSFKEQVVPMLDKAAARSNGRFRGSDFWEMVEGSLVVKHIQIDH